MVSNIKYQQEFQNGGMTQNLRLPYDNGQSLALFDDYFYSIYDDIVAIIPKQSKASYRMRYRISQDRVTLFYGVIMTAMGPLTNLKPIIRLHHDLVQEFSQGDLAAHNS